MTVTDTPLPDFLANPPAIGSQISVTGSWTPTQRRRFGTSPAAGTTWAVWDEIRHIAVAHDGVVSIEIDEVVGKGGVVVHLVAADADGLTGFLTTVAPQLAALAGLATPQVHMVRGLEVPAQVGAALRAAGIPTSIGTWIYGYERDDAAQTDPATLIEVTAVWRCTGDHLAELGGWWQQVGTEAHSIEAGLIRFEAYAIDGEDALVIHETFSTSDELKFHLTKGTAAMYKKQIDRVAAPDAYLFRGPVAWMIRTYSRFMRLPATYARRA